MTDDIIKRSAVLAAFRQREKYGTIPVELAEIIVKGVPKVDFESVDKVGNWVKMPRKSTVQKCEACGRIEPMTFNFCPYCGAAAVPISKDEELLDLRRRHLCARHFKAGWDNCDAHCPLHCLREPLNTCTHSVLMHQDEARKILDKEGVYENQ